MRKKTLISISAGILLVLIIFANTNNNYQKKEKEMSNKSLAIYIQNETGKYERSTSIPGKSSGYSFNTTMSVCDGSATVSWDNDAWGLELDNINRADTKCYLYFDK